MKETRWWKFVQDLIGQDTYRDAARKAGFDQSAFSRWKRGAVADPAFVLKLARAYNTNVLNALVEAEFITKEEAQLKEVSANTDPRAIPHETISSEVERRLLQLKALESDERQSSSNVSYLPNRVEHSGAPDVDTDNYGEDADSFEPERYVAKRKKPEPSLGDDDFGNGA